MTNYQPPSSIGPTDVGPYRLVRMIGEGGMGAVYYALRRTDNLAVALKILPRSLAMDNDQLARFRREAAVAMGLDHPNVVGCIDVDQSDGYNFMVMEFVGGGDAEELLRRSGGRISERRAMSISLDITKALHHASSFGLVHRDIKPENLLFTESGIAKLTDFGLVKRTAENLRITERGKAMGTPHFMAPEQARGKRDLDVRSDIYSLGATIYYLLCGQTPYNGNSAFEIVSQLASEPPPPLSGHRTDLSRSCLFIIECMMARELEDRPQSAKDLLVMIEAYFNGRTVPHPRDLTKTEKPTSDTGDIRKGDTQNPLKKLKAAEFQATPRDGRPPQPGEIPTNTITRHFMTSPTRILSKTAAPPPPSPESVSMPTAGMKVPLIKQNADTRKLPATGPTPTPRGQSTAERPVAAQPPPPGLHASPEPSLSPSLNRTPQSQAPAPLPMGIPLGQPFPGEPGYEQGFQNPDESGEQLTADLDQPLPQMDFPAAPPALPLPRAGRADTAFIRRPPAPDPFESGELITAEPATPANLPHEAEPPRQTPGPVTARFRIQTPPPEAYIEAPPGDDAEAPPPEAYIETTEGDDAPPALADTDAPETTPTPDLTADNTTTTPTAAGSGVTTPVATSEPPQPALTTSPEDIERIALDGSSPHRPAVDEPAEPQDATATTEAPATAPTPDADDLPPPPDSAAPADAATPDAAPNVADTAPSELDAAPAPNQAEADATAEFLPPPPTDSGAADHPPPPTIPGAATGEPSWPAELPTPHPAAAADISPDPTASSAETDAPSPPSHPAAWTPPAGAPSAEPAADIEPAIDAYAAAEPEPADAVATGAAAADDASAISPAPAAELPDPTPAPPLPPADAGDAAMSVPADSAVAFVEAPPPPPPMPTATRWAPTPGSPPPPDPATQPALNTRLLSGVAAYPAPAVTLPPAPPLSTLPAPPAPPPSFPVPSETAPESVGLNPDSLLARVRRLQSADTIAHEIPEAGLPPDAAPPAPPADTAGLWKYMVLGFISGVLITLVLVLLLR